MKSNVKGLSGIKRFFLAHGEKLGIAIVAMIAAFLVYRSLGLESLPANRQAAELEKQISQVSSAVDQSKWDELVKNHPENFPLPQEIPQLANKPIPPEHYPVAKIPLNPPVVPPTVLRTDPVLLTVQEVEANGGSGLLAFTNEAIRKERELEAQRELQRVQNAQQLEQEKLQKEQEQGRNRAAGRGQEGIGAPIDPDHPNRRPAGGMGRPMGADTMGDEEIKIAYWAVVVAKVPIKDQIKQFRESFENARGYMPGNDDLPNYLGYYVERAEVGTGAELQWKAVPVSNGKGQLIGKFVSLQVLYGGEPKPDGTPGKPGVSTDWASNSEELVDPRYLDPNGVLTFPLPPLVSRDWGKDVTHSGIPLVYESSGAEEVKPAVEETKPADAAEEADTFSGGAAGAGMAGRGGRPMMGARSYSGEGGMRGGRSPYGEGGGMMRGGREGGAYSRMGGEGMGTAQLDPDVPYWLLRFFDFTVAPGKKYRYRVKLVVQDPNQGPGVDTSSLASSVIKRIKDEKQARKTTPAIFYRVTLDWSEPSRTVSIPLAGSVKVVSATAASDRSFTGEPSTALLVESLRDEGGRGIQLTKEYDDFRRGSVANRKDKVEVLVERGTMIDELKDQQLQTGITVVDIMGGQKLGKEKTAARVLLMDPAGQLFIRNEMDDADDVKLHKEIFDKPKPGEQPAMPYGLEGRGRGGPPGGERGR